MEWFNVKEKSAGEKRLLLSWYLYKILGTKIAVTIAFFVSLITLLTNRDLREYSKKYFEALFSYTNNKKYKPSFLNSFRHVYSYAESLVYKMEAYAGTFRSENINFMDKPLEKNIYEQIKNKEGIIFICSHVGNIEVLRTFLTENPDYKPATVSILLQKDHCNIFNNFINKIGVKLENIKLYPIEEIDFTTASELDDDLKNGGMMFVAGDRIAVNNPDKHTEVNFLNKKIYLPQGTFKLAHILNYNTYIINCLKNKNRYDVYVEEQTNKTEEIMLDNYIKFLEKNTLTSPYQFYHFYDIFK